MSRNFILFIFSMKSRLFTISGLKHNWLFLEEYGIKISMLSELFISLYFVESRNKFVFWKRISKMLIHNRSSIFLHVVKINLKRYNFLPYFLQRIKKKRRMSFSRKTHLSTGSQSETLINVSNTKDKNTREMLWQTWHNAILSRVTPTPCDISGCLTQDTPTWTDKKIREKSLAARHYILSWIDLCMRFSEC